MPGTFQITVYRPTCTRARPGSGSIIRCFRTWSINETTRGSHLRAFVLPEVGRTVGQSGRISGPRIVVPTPCIQETVAVRVHGAANSRVGVARTAPTAGVYSRQDSFPMSGQHMALAGVVTPISGGSRACIVVWIDQPNRHSAEWKSRIQRPVVQVWSKKGRGHVLDQFSVSSQKS